jgi:murein L,D-transpeptidase YcbB/YkuD
MKRFLILATCVGLLLFLIGPFREGIGRFLSRSDAIQKTNLKSQPRSATSVRSAWQSARSGTEGSHGTERTEDIHEAIQEYRLRSTKRVKQVQRALKQAGFDPGPIDGLIGHRTHAALIEFQKAHGLESDGVLGVKTWEALRAYLPTAKATGVDTQ